MDEALIDKLHEADEEYIIVSKVKNDILDELDFENEEERLLCDSIITNLEKTASDTIRDMKVAQIPFIGCLRINPVKRKLRDAKLHLQSVRKSITKEQYKEHVRSYVIDLKERQIKEDRIKLVFTRIRRNNKKRYEELYKKLGKVYAELFIMSIYWLKPIEFDAEWQEQYDKFVDAEKDYMKSSTINRYKPKSINIDDNRPYKIIQDALDAQPRYRFK